MVAYFAFAQRTSDEKSVRLFFFKLTEVARISEARSIIADPHQAKRSVSGIIIPKRAPYNPEWSFHLEPASIDFFQIQKEVCDANCTYVEDHLGEIGGSTLPHSFWCPWSSHLIAEITHLIDPSNERLML